MSFLASLLLFAAGMLAGAIVSLAWMWYVLQASGWDRYE